MIMVSLRFALKKTISNKRKLVEVSNNYNNKQAPNIAVLKFDKPQGLANYFPMLDNISS